MKAILKDGTILEGTHDEVTNALRALLSDIPLYVDVAPPAPSKETENSVSMSRLRSGTRNALPVCSTVCMATKSGSSIT